MILFKIYFKIHEVAEGQSAMKKIPYDVIKNIRTKHKL